jgi:hypothetical protein
MTPCRPSGRRLTLDGPTLDPNCQTNLVALPVHLFVICQHILNQTLLLRQLASAGAAHVPSSLFSRELRRDSWQWAVCTVLMLRNGFLLAVGSVYSVDVKEWFRSSEWTYPVASTHIVLLSLLAKDEYIATHARLRLLFTSLPALFLIFKSQRAASSHTVSISS